MDTSGEDEFGAYVLARRRRLLRAAWLLTGDWHLAEDLLQTALAKAYLAWDRIEDPDAYVRRVLVTTHATWWRRKWRGERPSADVPDVAGHDPHSDAELRHQIVNALRRLPRRQRAVVVLRYFEDLTEVETAAVLGCSVGTVKSQASRALASMRSSTALADLAPAGNGKADL
jgi:RNA polymerase sigma-70 factor (sigma-E family)